MSEFEPDPAPEGMEHLDPNELAADGSDVIEGVEPPSEAEQLQYLVDHGWPTS